MKKFLLFGAIFTVLIFLASVFLYIVTSEKATKDLTEAKNIIVNKVISESFAMQPVDRIKQVSKKKLSINVDHLCSLPFQDEVEKSARTLVPSVYQTPDSVFAKKFDSICEKFI